MELRRHVEVMHRAAITPLGLIPLPDVELVKMAPENPRGTDPSPVVAHDIETDADRFIAEEYGR